MSKNTIAIIGMGPRGLSILERICFNYSNFIKDKKIRILVVDPNDMGCGTHYRNQPEYLLVNTVACQITMFGDDTIISENGIRKGPCLYQWAKDQGYKKINNKYKISEYGEELQPNDYLPRKILGEYLFWTYNKIKKDVNKNIEIVEVNKSVVDINNGSEIFFEDNSSESVDYIYLTTGHGKNFLSKEEHFIKNQIIKNQSKFNPLKYYSTPYPINCLDNISSKERVCIQGIGLTAYDIISHLTEGKGGEFKYVDNILKYLPSGNEPKIFIYSRQALPFSSRGANQKGISMQYSPYFFTYDKISDLREDNNSQLDFEKQVFPLIFKEMCFVYKSTLENNYIDPKSYDIGEIERKAISKILRPHEGLVFSNLEEYTLWFKEFLAKDISAANEGNVENPEKAATDILRDIRDILRNVIDYRGLTAKSHEHFLKSYNPLFNRIAVGPPKQRNEQLLALMNANVVSLAGGRESSLSIQNGKIQILSEGFKENTSIDVDVLIQARIEHFSPFTDSSLFMHNLSKKGILQPFFNSHYHPGGIDINPEKNPVCKDGKIAKNIWILGNLCEGANFYTYVLPRPKVNSRFLVDADNCVTSLYKQLIA